jgi:tetratricopeptide (TPR) repeat protein/predicted Ser/Thr protein kinase
MQCPLCQAENLPSAAVCTKCSTPLPWNNEDLGATMDDRTLTEGSPPRATYAWSVAVNPPAGAPSAQGKELIGAMLAERYEILELLGQGGMGAVYKARDTELERLVALKLIRPELASNPEILRRFKQELILAREVTHRNVIRIFDLGQAQGIKFITMEFVEGRDLRAVLKDKGKLPPDEAVKIIAQVCRALEAAHAAGVVHRDLKPQNIMLDAKDRVYVMDFGIAHSLETPGMTQTGALMGTPEYMSPEQARGMKVDARSDLFALGIIFYELLTGISPYKADTAIATLLKRTQERPQPPADLDPTIPKAISDVIMKCLEIDRDLRYSTAREILEDLGHESPTSVRTIAPTMVTAPAPPMPAEVSLFQRYRIWIIGGAAGLLLVLIGVASYTIRGRILRVPAGPHSPITVLVADFSNHTGDPVFDGTLEPMFNVALEGASFINAYNRGTARKLAEKLPNPTEKLDEQPARLVALSQRISTVIVGEISRRGDNYAVSAIALDAATGNVIAQAEATAASKDTVVSTIPKLVAPIRKALGDATPEAAQLERAGGAFTAASLEVVHQYGVAMEEQFAGKSEESLKSFAKAAELDPNFARAYSGMAASSIRLDRQSDAAKYMNLAMEHVDRMTDRERYRVRGLYYGTSGNWQKCAEEYSALVQSYPGDNIGHNNLAICLGKMRNLPKAIEEARRDVETNPNELAYTDLSVLTSYTGDFQNGETEARELRKRYPSSEYGYLALAFAQMGEGQLPDAADTYSQLAKLGEHGASSSAWGLADLAVYQGRFAESVRILEQGAAADLAAKNNDSAADKFTALAYSQLWMQRKPQASTAVEKALANSNEVKIRFLAAKVFAETGQQDKAQKLATGLAAEVQTEAQADAKMIEAALALQRKDTQQAIKALTDANTLLNTWLGHFELGRAYLEANAFAEADSEFDQCLRRRGEALSLFMDEVPTYGYLPPVYYYQGRVREGLKSAGFADSYRTYLGIRGQAGEDPLLPEIRKRLEH